MDPHDVLGVRPGASDEEIRAAYRRYAAAHHPDRGGDPSTFIAGQTAYRQLLRSSPPSLSGVQFHRRRTLGGTVRKAVSTAAHRIARRPTPPSRVL